MKGYWLILKGAILDPDAQAEYGRLWAPVAERYQARVAPRDMTPILKEAVESQAVLLVEFPSFELAQQCYDDPSYQKARRLATRAARREIVILRGDLA